MKDMNNYSTYDDNDYRAPWLKLNKEQMSDPFGWLLSQRNINVRAILHKMGYNDKQIGYLLQPNQIADKKPGFLQVRQRIGQKAVQIYLKWVFDNEVKKNKIKLGESQLRKIVAESVKKVLKEEHEWDEMLSGDKVLDGNIKDGNAISDIRLMCEFLQKYVMPNGEEQDGKFIYRGHVVDATEINRSIHEAVRYLYNIVKQFGY